MVQDPLFVEHIARQSFQRTSIFPTTSSSCTEVSPMPPQQLGHRLELVAGTVVVPCMGVVVESMAHMEEVLESMEEGPGSMAHMEGVLESMARMEEVLGSTDHIG